MAATNYTPISLYYSTTASAAPTAGNLTSGELAINITDGKLFYKDNSGVVQTIAYKNTPLNTVTGTLAVANGGTGQTSYTDGQLLIGNSTGNTLTKATLTSGSGVTITNGNGSISISATGSGGTVTSVGQTFTGGLISVAGSPVTTSGTLALTVAGTSGGIPYFSGASTWASSAALASNALMVGGGAGAAPATVTTGTGVVTALGVNTGSAGAFVVNGGALGTPSSGTVTNLTGTASININGTVGATTPAAGTFTSLSDSGNLTFTGTGNRITGDFSNSTVSSRVLFQSSTTNGATRVAAIPNGTGSTSALAAINNSDPTNAGWLQMSATSSEAQVQSTISGTGTYLPMTFYTGGSERMRLDTGGNVGIGTSSPTSKLQVVGSVLVTGSGNALRVNEDGAGTKVISIRSDFAGVGPTINVQTTDPLIFNTANTERMRIDSSGNVGIGTTSPDYQLDVSGSSSSTTTLGVGISVENSSNTTNTRAGIVFRNFDNYGASVWSPRTGSSAGALVFGTNGGAGTAETNIAERMRIDSSGNLLFNSGYGSVATAYGCRAWVNFNGSGTVAIRASGNVSSITDNGTGDYTINFTTAMSDINYAVTGTSGNADTGSLRVIATAQAQAPTTSTTRIIITNLATIAVDPVYVSVAIFR
jgi:hypothetical protein